MATHVSSSSEGPASLWVTLVERVERRRRGWVGSGEFADTGRHLAHILH